MSVAIASVVLKVAGRCNLNCSYCYLYNHEDRSTLQQPRFLSDAVFDALLERMARHCDHHEHRMSITFHGGEPTLAGPDRIAVMAERARTRLGERLANLAIQTNGTLIDERWLDVFKSFGISVGVSIDGPAVIHDRTRVTHKGQGSHAAVVRTIGLLADANIPVRVLCVVDPGQDGLAVYQHFRALGIECVDFLLPDVSHDNKMEMYGTAPHPVADYLLPILHAWLAEDNPRVVIPLFWNLLSRCMGSSRIETDCFGNPAMNYVVVNTDGSMEPLDALKVCANGITQTAFNVMQHELDDLFAGRSVLADALNGRFPLPDACHACRHRSICGGGYLPHRYSEGRGFNNASVWCEDIQMMLDRMQQIIRPVAISA